MQFVLALLTAIVVWPMVVVSLELAAALLPRRRRATSISRRPSVDVLIPAHNEEAGIAATLHSVSAQLLPGDRLLVVADNCNDATAATARGNGAIVFERNELVRRGKGFALEHGRRCSVEGRAEVVVVVDADCRLEPGTLDALAIAVGESGRPVQADYVMHSPPNPSPRDVVSGFAVTVKNRVRQRGTARLGGAAILTGSGMAFPRAVFEAARLDGGNIVEDMQLSFDLLLDGHAPMYCGEATVVAALPQAQSASRVQRTRWEHGHLQTLLRRVPKLAWHAIAQRRPILLGAAIDLSVPPLALLLLVWFTAICIAAAAAYYGYGNAPLTVLAVAGALLFSAVAVTAVRFGGELRLTKLLAAVPRYVCGKIPIYLSFLFRRQKAWVRTDRDPLPTRPHIGCDSHVANADTVFTSA